MKRKIIRIDEGKCDGCGACVPDCPEGAIKIEGGKAKLTGDRLLECALTIREGEIVYDPSGLSMPEWRDAPLEYWKTAG
jgi:ferredoxin